MSLRFSIRDLFWLTLVAALAVSWWLSYQECQHTAKILGIHKGRADALGAVLRRNPVLAAQSLHTCPVFDEYDLINSEE